ncbi:MAG: hypothetical protein QOG64_180 [Acidimicrobiaceae bacterium]|nr:hypothetical protein [Acidimicrobiaceae bacterium]
MGALLVLALLVVGGPYTYIHFIEGKAPSRLKLADPPAGGTAPTTPSNVPLDGTWKVAAGSQAGYRVKEVLFGQSNEAVGRTSNVTGSLQIGGTSVSAATFTVDMASVKSDQSRRDGQFSGRIMDVASFPTATFALTKPIELGSAPADGVTQTVPAEGQLTARGVTKPVHFTVTARRTGGGITVSGSVPVVFADWSIPNPSFAGITTEDHGVIEFLLNFAHA